LVNAILATALIWVSAGFYLSSNSIKDRTPLVDTEKAALDTRITDVKKDFDVLENQIKFLKTFPQSNYTAFIKKISEVLPSGVRLTNISGSLEGLNIKGESPDRSRVISLEESLRKEFDEVDAPLSNLVKSKDVEFVFTVK
jgi:Tfp pilus assembly protein PilN